MARRYWTVFAIFSLSLFLLVSLFFHQSFLLYALAVLVAVMAIGLYPQIGLYASIVLTMWFERHFTLQSLIINFHEYKLYPLDVVLGITVVSTMVHFILKKQNVQFRSFDFPTALFAAVMTLWFVVSLFLNTDHALAFGTYKNYLLYGVVYLLAVVLLHSKEEWQEFMRWFTIGGVGLFVFLILGLLHGQGLWSEFTPLSTYGTRLIAGTHAFYLALFGLWLVALFLWREKHAILNRALLALGLLGIGVGLAVSLVRHLWIALFFLLAFWFVLLPSKQRQQLFGLFGKGALLLIGTLFFVTLIVTSLTGMMPQFVQEFLGTLSARADVFNVLHLTDTSFGWRVSTWLVAFSQFLHAPIFGIGFGRVLFGIHEVTPFVIPVRDLHNNYLGILLQMGVIGFGVVAYWFFRILKTLKAIWQKIGGADIFTTRLFFLWGNATLLFMILFSISVYWDINLFVIFWWIGLAGVRWVSEGRGGVIDTHPSSSLISRP